MACSDDHSLQQALMTAAVELRIVQQLYWPRAACAALKGAAEAPQDCAAYTGQLGFLRSSKQALLEQQRWKAIAILARTFHATKSMSYGASHLVGAIQAM